MPVYNVEQYLSRCLDSILTQTYSCLLYTSVLDELGKVYDYIFLDTPPVNVVTDALVIAKFVSGILVVAKQKQTPHDLLKKTISSLQFAEAKILGFLMNEEMAKKQIYRHRYKYRSKYGYGYGYGHEEDV